jgi:hypothetical protein
MDGFETTAVEVAIWPYDRNRGVVSWHEKGERIKVTLIGDHEVAIAANREGLLGLARELLTLAQSTVPSGQEVYLMSKGQAPVLAPGSPSMRLVKGD